jgi:hypothetical protein
MRPRYSNRKQVKTNYETLSLTELILNDKIKQKFQLKKTKTT